MWRNDVKEILDDTEVEINAECIRGQCYPIAYHPIRKHGTNSVLLVPYTSMMATGIAGQGYNGKPRLKRCHLQAKSPSNAFLDSGDLDIAEDIGDDSEGEHFSQYPCWGVSIGIGLLEMDDEIFARAVKLGINQVHCVTEFALVNEITTVGHPEGIARQVAADIDNSTSYCHFDFLYLIEDKQAKFLVETVEHHHLAKRCVRFITMLLLGHL